MKGRARLFRVGIVAIVIIIALFMLASNLYTTWLWFQNLQFSSVFLTMLISKILIGLAAALVFFLIVGINYYVARIFVKKAHTIGGEESGISLEGLPISEKGINWAIGAFVIIVALMIGSVASTKWSMILRYIHAKSFGISDPIFVRDVAFYVFSLPFYLFLKSWIMGFIVFSGVVALFVYSRGNLINMEGIPAQAQGREVLSSFKLRVDSPAWKHLSIVGIIIVALLIWGYWLKIYELMYSTQGPAFGASYTDIHVQWIAYIILMVVLGVFAIFLAVNMLRQRRGALLVGLAIILGTIVVAGSIIPSLVQKIIVKPNELDRERQYIAYNIENTRKAYNLDRIQEKDFIINENLTMADIMKNKMTIENIRIWDERPLKETYDQLQSIRLYYNFSGIDVDRYLLD
ncbi:MAG: UPF0182 family protein, partial [Thermodesulfobacteriota bacterium]